jgi:phasin family protein
MKAITVTGEANRVATVHSMICQEDFQMITGFDEMQKFGKDNMDTAMKSLGAVSKTMQAIATEMTDYSKKSFEDSTAALEKLMGAKTIEKAIEVQSEFFKSAYEGFVAEATKLGDMYSDLAKETYKPVEGIMTKVKNAA